VRAVLGDDAGILGAARIAFDWVLSLSFAIFKINLKIKPSLEVKAWNLK
jgi:hypothetical protein